MHVRLISAALALSLAGLSPAVLAQNADLISASISTCNVKGSASITVAGITTTLPVACINPSQETSPGNDEDSVTGNVSIGVPGVVNVTDLAAPYGESNYVNAPNKTWLAAGTTVEDASLVQDMVAASGVRGLMICESDTGDATVSCTADTQIAQLRINDQPVALPQGPIPRNYPVAITGGAVQITVLGLTISVPVSGSVTLNETTVHGVGTHQLTVEHAPLHVRVSGSTMILGIGIVELAVDVVDFAQGDMIAIPAGVTHWTYNHGDDLVIPVTILECTSPGGTCAP